MWSLDTDELVPFHQPCHLASLDRPDGVSEKIPLNDAKLGIRQGERLKTGDDIVFAKVHFKASLVRLGVYRRIFSREAVVFKIPNQIDHVIDQQRPTMRPA